MYCEDCKRPDVGRKRCLVCAGRKYRSLMTHDFCFLRKTPASQGDIPLHRDSR